MAGDAGEGPCKCLPGTRASLVLGRGGMPGPGQSLPPAWQTPQGAGGAGFELFVVMARVGWEGQEVTMAAKSPPATSDFRGGWGARPRLQGHTD